MVVSRSFTPGKNQDGHLGLRMAILILARSETSRIGKINLATVQRISPSVECLSHNGYEMRPSMAGLQGSESVDQVRHGFNPEAKPGQE
jgi:hypothetical protein